MGCRCLRFSSGEHALRLRMQRHRSGDRSLASSWMDASVLFGGNAMKRKEHRGNLKHCSSCDTWHDLGEFHKHSRNWDALHAYCKSCMRSAARRRFDKNRDRLLVQSRDYRAKNPEKRRDTRLRSRFGITADQFDAMKKTQGGACAICHRVVPLHVDHCHTTKAVRGLLCMPCNTAIGQFEDNPDRIRAAASYVEARK